MGRATVDDAFRAAAGLTGQVLDIHTEKFREQNILEVNNRNATIHTNIQDWIRDNQFVGGANEEDDERAYNDYLGKFNAFVDEQYADAGRKNNSQHYQRMLEQSRTQTIEAARNLTLGKADEWRIQREDVSRGEDIQRYINSGWEPQQILAAINNRIELSGTKRPINPQQRNDMQQAAERAVYEQYAINNMEQIRDVNDIEAAMQGVRDAFGFMPDMSFNIYDEEGNITGTEERSWGFENKEEWEKKLIEFTKNRIYQESMETALTDDARYRRMKEEALRTGNFALNQAADAIARPYLNGPIAEILAGIRPEDQQFVHNFNSGDHARLAGLFQSFNSAEGSGRSGGFEATIREDLQTLIHRQLTGEEDSFNLSTFYRGLRSYELYNGEYKEGFVESMYGYEPGSNEYGAAITFIERNFLTMLDRELKNNTAYQEQGHHYRRLIDTPKRIAEEFPDLDEETISGLQRYFNDKALTIMKEYEFWRDNGNGLDQKIKAIDMEIRELFTFQTRTGLFENVAGNNAENQRWMQLQFELQKAEANVLSYINPHGQQRSMPVPDSLKQDLEQYEAWFKRFIASELGVDAEGLNVRHIPMDRNEYGHTTSRLSNALMASKDGRHYRLHITEENGNLRGQIQEGNLNRDTGNWEWGSSDDRWEGAREIPGRGRSVYGQRVSAFAIPGVQEREYSILARNILPEAPRTSGGRNEDRPDRNNNHRYGWYNDVPIIPADMQRHFSTEGGGSSDRINAPRTAVVNSIIALNEHERENFNYEVRPSHLNNSQWEWREMEGPNGKKEYWEGLFAQVREEKMQQLNTILDATGGYVLPKPTDLTDQQWARVTHKNIYWSARIELAEHTRDRSIPGFDYSLNGWDRETWHRALGIR